MNAPIDVTNMCIETDRLILRPWRESDLHDFYEYASVDGVGQLAGWMPHQNVEESRMILNKFIEGKKTLALVWKESGKVIGSLGIEKNYDEPEIPNELLGRQLGFVLSKEYWGRGLMPEAVNAVISYCFRVLHLDYLTCAHFVRNDQSRRVIEKTGFQFLKNVYHETRYGTTEETKLYIQYNPLETNCRKGEI